MRILGFYRKSGEYQGTQFDNYYLFLASPIDQDGYGYQVDKVKCKSSILKEFLSSNNISNDKDLINIDVVIYFDKYRNLSFIGLK